VTRGNLSADEAGCPVAAELAAELRQPLTAVGNYIGIARMLLGPAEPQQIQRALESLEKAESQILRAGDIVRRLRRVLRAPGTDDE
jgi:two-component system sensor kinase FixL